MKKTGYDQFFKAASQAKKPPAVIEKAEAADQRLRAAFKMKAKPKRKPFPVLPLVGCVGLMGVGLLFLARPQLIDELAKVVEVKFMGSASAEEKTAEKPAAAKGTPAKDAASEGGEKKTEDGAKVKTEKEDLSYIDKLRSRKEDLDLREKELNQLEEELQRQKVEVDARIRQLESMRRDIAGVLKERVDADETQVNKLVELYSTMKPKQAADILGSLQEDLAVQVLGKMKKKNAAEVMNLLPSDKARGLSEKLTGYKR